MCILRLEIAYAFGTKKGQNYVKRPKFASISKIKYSEKKGQ